MITKMMIQLQFASNDNVTITEKEMSMLLCDQYPIVLMSAWINNYMPNKVWDEITYPFLNFNGCTVEV